MTGSDLVAHNIGLARRVRPSRGPCAPYIAGGHPVDDSSASGTTSWPSWPTRSPCRPASGPRPAGRVGHEWPAEGPGSAATPPPAVPAPQVGWWTTPCSGRRSSWPRRTRSRRTTTPGAGGSTGPLASPRPGLRPGGAWWQGAACAALSGKIRPHRAVARRLWRVVAVKGPCSPRVGAGDALARGLPRRRAQACAQGPKLRSMAAQYNL